MHELSVAQNIIDIVSEHVNPGDKPKIKKIRLRIGELAGIVTDSLLFCFDAVKNETTLGNAVLDIQSVPITARCNPCGTISQLEYGVFFCPLCAGSDIELLTGTELNIADIELDD